VSSGDNDENARNTSNDDNNPLNNISDAWSDVEREVSNAFNDLANSVIDEAADFLDIPDWYSLHVMTICEGMNAGLNVTQCSGLTSESTYTASHWRLSTKLALDLLDPRDAQEYTHPTLTCTGRANNNASERCDPALNCTGRAASDSEPTALQWKQVDAVTPISKFPP
jgi:hypothetical protein